MRYLKTKYGRLVTEQRWDIDYHFPAVEIKKYNRLILRRINECADIITDKRNPTLDPEKDFLYVDISSIDVSTGTIVTPQLLKGEDAPSRARKVIRKGDIIISTCRPTRGAIAVVPEELDNQICSTGFCVIRAKNGTNNGYLHFMLRSAVVKEQFRKFSTGSSYPAILDDDIKKTIIPLPPKPLQDKIAEGIYKQVEQRNQVIAEANRKWSLEISKYMDEVQKL